ncbi:MAG: hypothetical protein EOO96_00440 [Pedobacter sp.]|nr:MAG: hypothetical protein EOO96_00440 [Pedobacter sp.]
MKRLGLLLFNVLIYTQAFSQNAKVISIINFTGAIDKYPIEMRLDINHQGDSVSGEYYYTKNIGKEKIYLEGTLKDGILRLTESAYSVKKRKYENTGKFQLNYIDETSLNGSWQKSAKKEKYLSVKLKARENLKAFNPSSNVFQYTRNRANLDYIPADAQHYFNVVSLKIFVNKSMRWAFTEFGDAFMREANVELQDLNFDGYLDFKVPIYYPGVAKGDYSYLYFVYHPDKKGFIQNKQLNEKGVIFFDSVKKEAQTVDADGSGNEGTQYYRWYNGKLLLVKEERVYENDAFTHVTYYKVENGKAVKVRTEKRK